MFSFWGILVQCPAENVPRLKIKIKRYSERKSFNLQFFLYLKGRSPRFSHSTFSSALLFSLETLDFITMSSQDMKRFQIHFWNAWIGLYTVYVLRSSCLGTFLTQILFAIRSSFKMPTVHLPITKQTIGDHYNINHFFHIWITYRSNGAVGLFIFPSFFKTPTAHICALSANCNDIYILRRAQMFCTMGN